MRHRPRRLSGLPVNRLIPNVLTVLALCAGMTAVLYGFQGKWHLSVAAILVAGALDGIDGRLARLLGGTTKFGAELDSLSDFVSFGVVPALMLFLWTLQDAHGFGWAAALIFAVCAGLRLARFNTHLGVSDMPRWAYNFFTGVPAPAAGGLVLLPMILSFSFDESFLSHPLVNGPVAVGVAFLMISRIPTYSFKRFKVPHRLVIPLLLVVGLVAALLVTATWLTIAGLLILYLLSIPLSFRTYRRLARATMAAGDDVDLPLIGDNRGVVFDSGEDEDVVDDDDDEEDEADDDDRRRPRIRPVP